MIAAQSTLGATGFGAVVFGLSPTGLHVLRELGCADVPLRGVTGSIEPGRYSRYLDDSETILADHCSDRLLDALMAMAARSERRWVLIPTSDSYIEFIVRNRDALAQAFKFQSSYNTGLFKAIVDKREFAELCGLHNVEAPRCWIQDASELGELGSAIQFPVLLKPAFIHIARRHMGGRKVLVARESRDYQALVSEAKSFGGQWLAQEVIPGPESNITLFGAYFDHAQTAHQVFTARKLRQYPPGFGSASLVSSKECRETAEISIKLFRSLKYQGIASAEFKRDPRDGRLKIIEINPRPSLWFAAAHHAGKRISLACFRDLAGMELPEENQQSENVLWRYLFKDVYSASFYKTKGAGFVLERPDVKTGLPLGPARRVGPILDMRDWRPVLGEGVRYAIQGLSRIARKVRRLF